VGWLYRMNKEGKNIDVNDMLSSDNSIIVKYFCSDCERESCCDYKHPKLHQTTRYIYRYLLETQNGNTNYPRPGSWEHQTEWFTSLLTTAQNELARVIKEG